MTRDGFDTQLVRAVILNHRPCPRLLIAPMRFVFCLLLFCFYYIRLHILIIYPQTYSARADKYPIFSLRGRVNTYKLRFDL